MPPEVRDPVLLHQPTRKGVGYFGAVRLRDGRFVYRRETDSFNGDTFFAFMKQLARASRHPGRRVVVITDHATYHHATLHRSWRDTHEGRFVLDFLPPYSPDVNPIERVWTRTRRRCPHNRYFPTLEAITTAVDGGFDRWTRGNDTSRRLCAIT